MTKKQVSKDKTTLTDTPKDEEITIRSDVSSYDPFRTTPYNAGDSVNEHKEQEEANQFIANEEIKQQMENN
ncbi:hypothetical protein [Bacillus alkalicellulosilyticus]|uniref:hypothetical protein n=1 Tax=Alkalihalobacterium alkalicellulosilyticum TaxID=1912214 RepID=UPI00099767C0|nr:hypothetical protein [Bacillus alkalicellulosilyticus]